MKKNIKTVGILALMATVALTGADTVSAASFNGKKYYVNPGHGGHDSDDRPTPLPLGVEMFYESDGNLSRGLFLRDFLQANGASVKMSRVTNYSSDDLALSTIASQSNSYGGYFMSLHTNGANASANYIVSFYRTTSSAPSTETIAGSQSMALAVSQWHDKNHLTNMTYSTPRALGCYAFYGYNLGVLGPNNRPGYLVETVFHDYRPDGLRLKSDVYNKYTAWQILMATRQNSGGSTGMTDNVKGCIVGDIRDLSKTCGYTNYTSRGRDSYLAVNGAKVVLKNSSGAQVATMNTDNCANGLFGFFDLAAGTYTLEFSKDGYKTQTKSVTVSDNASTKVLIDLVQGTNEGISVTPSSYQFQTVTLSGDHITTATAEAVQFTISTSKVTDPITITSSNPEIFVANKTSIAGDGSEKFKVRFMPVDAGNFTGTITLKSGSFTTNITVTGSATNPPLAMSTGYVYGETAGKNPDWLPSGGWSLLRNMCFGDGHLYLVNASENTIYVVDAQTCKLIKKLDMTGINGGTFKVMDVKYVGGKIVACNLAAKAEEPVKVYVWDNEDAKPRCILNTTERKGVSRLGDTFDVDGNLTNGRLLFAYGGTDGDDSRVFSYEIKDGNVNTTSVSYLTQDDGGNIIKLGTSPRAVSETDGRFWVMGQQLQPTLIGASGKAETSMSLSSICNAIQGNDFKRFNYKGTPYALVSTYAAPGADGAAAGETLTRGGAALIDCTNGWNDGELLQKYPSNGLGTTRNTSFSTSVDYYVNGEDGVEFWVLVSNQGLGYYKSGIVPDYSNTDPTITTNASTTDFGTVLLGKSESRTFNIQGRRLTGDITINAEGDGFSVTPTTISKDNASGDITVTYRPTAEGFHVGTLTISTPGVDVLTYQLDGQCVAEKITGDRGHFAYNLTGSKAEGNVYNIKFHSTGDASKAVLVVTNASNADDVITEVIGAVQKGENTYAFDASGLTPGDKYNWAIRIHNYEISKTTVTTPENIGGARAAVTTFTDPAYPETFGYTVVGRATNTGIDIYNQAGQLVQSKLHAGCAVFGGTGATNPMDATTRGNEVYFASWNDKAYGVVAYDITTPEKAPYSVFEGTKASSGLISSGSTQVGSGTPTVGVWGTGDNTTLIVFDEDIFSNALAKNVIGTGKTTNKALQLIGDTGYKSQFANTNVNVKALKDGFFATQIRGNGLDPDVYSLAWITMPAGELTWKWTDMTSDASLLPSSAGGVDVSADGSLLAISTYDDIRVFNLSWTGGKPSLTPYATATNPFGRTTKQTLVKFDYAGNIHAVNVDNGYFKVYLAHPENIVETPASDGFQLTTGVEDVISTADSATPVYYNLNGVRMPDGDTLTPGIYIKVVGRTATKIVVR